MPASKAKKLSSLFRSAIKTTSRTSLSAEDITLKHFVSSLDPSSPSTSTASDTSRRRPSKFPKSPSCSKNSASKAISNLTVERLKLEASSYSEDSTKELSEEISSILLGGTSLRTVNSHVTPEMDDDKPVQRVLEIPWFSSMSNNNISLRRKELSRDRKQKWVFKSTQTHRFDRLVRMCGQKLGADATLQVFGKLGRETGVKEYNALVSLCIEKAKTTEDEEVSLQQIYKAYQLFKSMQEQGFQLEEETYGPFLMFLIEMEMVEEFQFFREFIHDENSKLAPRVAYYEMLLWIRVNNEEKIKELCDYIATQSDGDKFNYKENYLLALCERDRKEELLLLFEIVDITNFSSPDHLASIFRSLGRLLLESFAKKFILALKNCDTGAENISNFIYSYAISIPNLAVEDVILMFKNLHRELVVMPSSTSYEKLITHCCDSLKAHVALDIVDQMFESDLTLSIETVHSILQTCEESYDYNLVHRIYSVIRHNNLKPNNETFRIMINLCVKMKDFHGAYRMIKDLEEMNLMPTANIFNAIIAGYFREKNFQGVSMVLKEMERADVKPDSQTFSYLIGNCECEADIVKCYEEMKQSGVQITKHVFMALINAYAACGQFEKAKQIVLDKGVPAKILNEIKCVLVSALASHGQISDALSIYEEIKKAECIVDPRSIIYLMEHLQSKGDLGKLLQLLEEINHSDYWIDGCFRVALYCVRHRHLSSTMDLLKQFKNKFCDDQLGTEAFLDEIFSEVAEMEPAGLHFGLDLLQAIKEDLDVHPSRKSLDFLLGACVNAKDLCSSLLIWEEYQTAGLPYNSLTFLRMYQALLASGDHKAARKLLNIIPKDDPHVRCVIKASYTAYSNQKSSKGQKKDNKKSLE